MGCCDSHVFQSENSSDKYLIHPSVSQLPHQNQTIYFQPIPNLRAQIDCKSDQNQDDCSLHSLRYHLENIFPIFQDHTQLSSFQFIGGQVLSHSCIDTKKNIKICDSNTIIRQDFANESHFKNFFDNSSETISNSEFAQNNSQIISNASLSSKRQLEKQLFYLNSDCIGNIKLLKWSEQNRQGLSLNINFEELLQKKCNNFLFLSLLQIKAYEENHKIHLISYKILNKGFGIKIYANGKARMLSLSIESKVNIFQTIVQEVDKKIQILSEDCQSFCIQLLTGWIPEIIYLSEFHNFEQVFYRLAKNFCIGNLLISFTMSETNENFILKSIDTKRRKMRLIDRSLNEKQYSWDEIIRNFPIANANWSPSIYFLSRKVQAISKIKPECEGRSNPQFLIKIPPSKSQVEVRFVVNIHRIQSTQKPSRLSFNIHLYEYNGMYLKTSQNIEPIRTSKSYKNLFLSDIFIFEKSQIATEYLILVEFVDYLKQSKEDIQITLDFYSFCQINVKLLPEPQLRSHCQISSQVSVQNAGYGMNSPYFQKNLKYSLKTPLNALVKLTITTKTTKNMLFQICILPDTTMNEDLTFVSPTQIVKQVIQSEQFQNEGVLQFKTKRQSYIIIIVGFTPTEGQISINAQLYSTNEELLEIDRFSIFQSSPNYVFLKEVEFLWSINNPGPRKRTKNNTGAGFYPIKTFQKFFENPYLDYNLSQGIYQFSIISQDFQNSIKFPSVLQDFDDFAFQILSATPPNLSIGIYQLSEDGSEAKIVLDDYEYVPYGIGFWTTSFRLQGPYRFVFSKIEQSSQRGLFRIRKLDSLHQHQQK